MADDLFAAAEHARQQSEAFLSRSREQMQSTFAEQRAMAVGVPPGMGGGAAAGGGGGAGMLGGTAAGRLLDTINQLIRTGAGAAGAAIGGPMMGAAGGMGAMAQGIGGGAAFMAGSASFGPAGIGLGAATGAQNRMNFWQMAFTGWGAGAPFGLGRYAAQRTDMNEQQATQMAREETMYRMYGGGLKGVQSAWNTASFGLSNFMLRRQGLTFEWFRGEDFNRNIQNNLRFVSRETLGAAGMGRFAGAFATGVTREGAMAIGAGLRQQVGDLERMSGMDPDTAMAMQSRALGTMGAGGINQALRKGVGNFTSEAMRNIRGVQDVQKILGLSEQEADAFFQTMGQMHGTASRIAGMAKQAQQAAGRMGMDVRDVMGLMVNFENMGRTQMIGQNRMGQTGMRMGGRLRGLQMAGAISGEESMAWGGSTPEQGLQIMTQRAFEVGQGMLQRGQFRGMEYLMQYNQGAYAKFMGGGMGVLQAAGVAGGMMMADPLMGLKARYDPALQAKAGEEGIRMAYQRVQAMKNDRQYIFGGTREEMLYQMEQETGLGAMETQRWFDFHDRERGLIQRQIKGIGSKPEDQQIHDNNILQLHAKLRSEGLMGTLSSAMGTDEFTAVGNLYKQITNNGSTTEMSDKPLIQQIRGAFEEKRAAIGSAAAKRAPEIEAALRADKGLTGGNVSRVFNLLAEGGVDRKKIFKTLFDKGNLRIETKGMIPEGGGGIVAESVKDVLRAGMSLLDKPARWLAGNEVFQDRAINNPWDTRKRGHINIPKGGFAVTSQEISVGAGGQTVSVVDYDSSTTPGRFIVDKGDNKGPVGLTIDELRAQYPTLADRVESAFGQTLENLGAGGWSKMMTETSGKTEAQKAFLDIQGAGIRSKLSGVASAFGGGGAEGLNLGQIVDRLRSMGSDQLEALGQRMPQLAGILKQLGTGSLTLENVQAALGPDQFSKIVEDLTGQDPATIKNLIEAKDTGYFNTQMLNTVVGHVMSQQDLEIIGQRGSNDLVPTFVTFGESALKGFSAAIANALKAAGVGNP